VARRTLGKTGPRLLGRKPPARPGADRERMRLYSHHQRGHDPTLLGPTPKASDHRHSHAEKLLPRQRKRAKAGGERRDENRLFSARSSTSAVGHGRNGARECCWSTPLEGSDLLLGSSARGQGRTQGHLRRLHFRKRHTNSPARRKRSRRVNGPLRIAQARSCDERHA